jgi:hypothetical protein
MLLLISVHFNVSTVFIHFSLLLKVHPVWYSCHSSWKLHNWYEFVSYVLYFLCKLIYKKLALAGEGF